MSYMKFIELYIRGCKKLEEEFCRQLTAEEKKRVASLVEAGLTEMDEPVPSDCQRK